MAIMVCCGLILLIGSIVAGSLMITVAECDGCEGGGIAVLVIGIILGILSIVGGIASCCLGEFIDSWDSAW